MDEVKIRKSKKGLNRRSLIEAIGKGALLTAFYAGGFGSGYLTNEDKDKTIAPKAVMIVLKDGKPITKEQGQVATSVVLYRSCKELGYKFRMYKDTADLFQEEEWVKQMHKQALEYGCPCVVVVDDSGRGRCYSIPTNIADAIKLIGGNDEV